MPSSSSKNLERKRLLQKALARWENEGGHDTGTGKPRAEPDELVKGVGGVPPLTNAELVQLQIRVIALENLVVALLAQASKEQLQLVHDISQSIVPRPGVEHRLTAQAAVQMAHLAQRSGRV